MAVGIQIGPVHRCDLAIAAMDADVITIETIDLESLGPNAVLGQRNWIDLRQ